VSLGGRRVAWPATATPAEGVQRGRNLAPFQEIRFGVGGIGKNFLECDLLRKMAKSSKIWTLRRGNRRFYFLFFTYGSCKNQSFCQLRFRILDQEHLNQQSTVQSAHYLRR